MMKLFSNLYEAIKADAVPLDEIFEEFYLPHLPIIAGGAVTVSPQSNQIATKLIYDSDADGTSEADMTGTSGVLYVVDIDNTANAAASYVKLYDAAAPTIGTTAPDWIFKVAASVRRVLAITEGFAFTNLSMACVTAGGTAGTTNPTSNVAVRLLTT
mgnify:CR=1 FL=1